MGQANKNVRHCPVLNNAISPSECGESRTSRITCPADCRHNPWSPSTYEQALAIETVVYDKLRQRLSQEHRSWTTSIIRKDIPHTLTQFTLAYFIDRDANGLTLFQRWERDNWRNLTNDQIVFLKALSAQYATAIEVLEIRNDEETLVRDRLNLSHAPFLIHDRKMAEMAGRFTGVLTCLVDMPHYTRVNGAAIPFPLLNNLEAEDILHAIAEHERWPTESPALQQWLLTHFGECSDSITAIHEAAEDAFMKNAFYTKAWYRLVVSPSAFIAAMQSCPAAIASPIRDDLNEGMTHEWSWKAPAEGALPDAIPTLGRVLCGHDTVRIEAGGELRAKSLRKAFEQFAENKVRFERQRVDDLGTQMRSRKARLADPARVPPSLTKHFPSVELTVSLVSADPANPQAKAQAVMNDAMAHWGDAPIPALNGKTPRQAVQDPALRPKVVHMVKQMISRGDRAGLHGKHFRDEACIARDLGLTELDYPVPPRLRALATGSQDAPPQGEDQRPLGLGLPAALMALSDVKKRVADVKSYFDGSEEMVEAFESEAPDLYDWVCSWDPGSYSEDDIDMLLFVASMVWFIAYPPDCSSPGIDIDRLHIATEQSAFHLKASLDQSRPDFDRFISKRQPALSLFFQKMFVELANQRRSDLSISTHAVMACLLLCQLLVDELALSSQVSRSSHNAN
jgi:hypothetical protein